MSKKTGKRFTGVVLLVLVGIIGLVCFRMYFYTEESNGKNSITIDPVQKNETWEYEKWDGTYVSYGYNGRELHLPSLDGWEYKIIEYVDENTSYGINFHPTGENGWIEFHYHPFFGVCGTGLVEKEYGSGQMGIYDDQKVWTFITYPASEGTFVAITNRVESWWPQYGEEAMAILDHSLLTHTVADKGDVAAADFSVRLFQHSFDAENNTLISPVSVLYALSMVANGADGNTRAQMEQVLGLPLSEQNV